ncbi:MAG: hypothetical protein JRN13_03115 [Nitrososphaerota archaeon]|nr:hypothetical protein [Nitrososphaerota archaeon]MDG6937071.1 hypothetical protein [Nitrososphaerota archaeon]MDG6972312.1 hypothetical protein [Nitrososphaerota archaeon]MDG6986951.1 hypothetical protein [Nitrososphaerota archaeon]MDG7017872.1 hypothetical protein [Nitrososphaerota archaeon]
MRLDRRGVAGFLEVFILIAVAMGGAALVMEAALGYFAAMGGGSVSVAGASIRQGPYSAVETVLVTDTSGTALGSFVVSTSGAPSSAGYCYSVYDPSDQGLLASACPAAGSDPASVRVATPLGSGAAVLVEVVVSGDPFAIGSSHLVTVTAADGAQQAVEVEVVPA